MTSTPRRIHTPDRRNDDGSTTVTMKRACNGCGQLLGDLTDQEINRAVDGLPLSDVRAECPHCAPLVELEAAARTVELDRDAASSGESRDYQRGMTRAVQVLRLLDSPEHAEEQPGITRPDDTTGATS